MDKNIKSCSSCALEDTCKWAMFARFMAFGSRKVKFESKVVDMPILVSNNNGQCRRLTDEELLTITPEDIREGYYRTVSKENMPHSKGCVRLGRYKSK